MQFGLQVNPYFAGPTGNAWDAVAAAARAADASGFDSLWLYDHLLYEGGYSGHPYPEPVMEVFTTLGAVAAITNRVRLGQLVLGVPYRNPALVGKMATSLDLISHGRSILGLGAGWHKREYEGLGWGEFEEVGVRMKRLEEAVQVIVKMWTERPANFAGKYYRLDNVMDNPAPIQKPHPPIMIGGSGEKVTLRLCAQYAQWCNISGDVADVRRRLDILHEHCQKVGRNYEEITRSSFATVIVGKDDAEVAAKRERLAAFVPGNGALIGTPEQLIAIFKEYEQAGIQYCVFRMPDWVDVEPIQLFSERVIPALAG
jgi:F420-dependent oxidoreductase-like protein